MTACPKHILDFWQAFDHVEPLASPWQQTAKICAQVETLVGIQYAKGGVKDYKGKTEHDFMPPQWSAPKTILGPAQSNDEIEEVFKATAKRCQQTT